VEIGLFALIEQILAVLHSATIAWFRLLLFKFFKVLNMVLLNMFSISLRFMYSCSFLIFSLFKWQETELFLSSLSISLYEHCMSLSVFDCTSTISLHYLGVSIVSSDNNPMMLKRDHIPQFKNGVTSAQILQLLSLR